MSSNTVLVSGSAMGAAQILIWSYSCVFCLRFPQSSELVHFLLWKLSMYFYIFHGHKVCLVDCVDLIRSLYSWWEGFGSSLATLPLGSILVLFPPLGEGNGNPLQYSCLKNPMDRGVWRVQPMGSQRVRHDWLTFTHFTSTSTSASSLGVCSWGCPGGLEFALVRTKCGIGTATWVPGVWQHQLLRGVGS